VSGSRIRSVALSIRKDIMNYSYRRGACVFIALAALASPPQAQTRPGDPADAAAPVPPTRYAPSIAPTPAAPALQSPPQAWKALNAVVGAYDSMTLTMEGAAAAPSPPASGQASATQVAPAARGSVPATQPAPDPHAHHRPKAAK
jgi:hypothetical protein